MESPKNKDFSGELDLSKIKDFIGQNKKFIFYFVSIGTILFSIYAYSLPDQFKSSAVLKVNSDSSSSQSIQQYQGIASIIGIDVSSSSGVSKSDLALEILSSKSFIKHLLSLDDFSKQIVNARGFDNETSKILYKNSSVIGYDFLEVHEVYFNEMLDVSIDKRNFIKVSITHVSPIFSKSFLEFMITELNNLVKNQDMEEASSSLNYPKLLLPNTKDIELKNSIAELMKSNLKIMTLTNIKDDYILEYVDHPFLPQEKDSPHRILIIIIGFLVSFFSAVTLLIIFSSIKEKGREST